MASFSADAIIRKTVTSLTLLSDDFNRVIPEWDGWGNGWIIDPGSFSPPATQAGEAAVDGSAAYSGAHQWFDAIHPSIPDPVTGDFDLYFDFRAEPTPGGSGWSEYIYAQYGSSWFDLFPDSTPTTSPYDTESDKSLSAQKSSPEA